jgi:hypothetical protein
MQLDGGEAGNNPVQRAAVGRLGLAFSSAGLIALVSMVLIKPG